MEICFKTDSDSKAWTSRSNTVCHTRVQAKQDVWRNKQQNTWIWKVMPNSCSSRKRSILDRNENLFVQEVMKGQRKKKIWICQVVATLYKKNRLILLAIRLEKFSTPRPIFQLKRDQTIQVRQGIGRWGRHFLRPCGSDLKQALHKRRRSQRLSKVA